MKLIIINSIHYLVLKFEQLNGADGYDDFPFTGNLNITVFDYIDKDGMITPMFCDNNDMLEIR